MTALNLSQRNLLKLARKNQENDDLNKAIQNVEEALRGGREPELVLELCDLYLKDKHEYSAYVLIKEESDLFSDKRIYTEYSKILKANHFFIEATEVENLSHHHWKISAVPVDENEQKAIMRNFRQKKQPTQFDYERLFKLDINNFKNFTQSLLLDPSLNFAVRLALCEDLVRLGVKEKFKVIIVGNQEEFVPEKTDLLEKDPIYREVVSGIGSRFYHRPSQMPVVLGEVNLILGSLYPKLAKFVDEPDSFASDLASYIENHDGRSNHDLFVQIDNSIVK